MKSLPEWLKAAIGLILGFGVPICLLVEEIVNRIKRNRENARWKKSHAPGPRRQCVDCKYCKTKIYKPFYRSCALAQIVPVYCRKFHKKLTENSELRCIAELAKHAEYENNATTVLEHCRCRDDIPV